MQNGIVKWFRHDGTGYLYTEGNPERSILFDTSSIVDGSWPNKGDLVEFESKMILGREIAVRVKLRREG
jgi:hypothetical protein